MRTPRTASGPLRFALAAQERTPANLTPRPRSSHPIPPAPAPSAPRASRASTPRHPWPPQPRRPPPARTRGTRPARGGRGGRRPRAIPGLRSLAVPLRLDHEELALLGGPDRRTGLDQSRLAILLPARAGDPAPFASRVLARGPG